MAVEKKGNKKMKTLNKYIISSIYRPFTSSLIIFSMFMFFGAAFEKLKLFSKAENGGFLLIKYLIYQTPFLISMIIPLSLLMATLFLINSLIITGQWKAMLAGGYKPFDILKPLLYFSLVISIIHFIFNETIVSDSFFKSKDIYNRELRKKQNWEISDNTSISFKIDNIFVRASSYNPDKKEFLDVLLEEYDNYNNPLKKIKASSMLWWKNEWILKTVKIIEYKTKNNSQMENIKEQRKDNLYLNSIPEPENLILDKVVENGINFFKLYSRISKMEKLGLNKDKEMIVLHSKISQPFSNITMLLIGSVIILTIASYNKFVSISIAIFVGFIYWSFSIVSQKMSEIGIISPFLGAFLPHFIFISLSFFMLKKRKLL